MTGNIHMFIGSTVLLLSLVMGIWLVISRRSSKRASTAHTIGLALVVAILAVQILAGVDLLSHGKVPAPGVLGLVHVAGPIVAFVVGLWALLGPPREQLRHYILADHLTFLVALISFVIGASAHPG